MRTVGGRYQLVERIGSGAMGVVWRARDALLGREVAVKQLRLPDLDPERARLARARAMREARNAARLHHPDAITVFDVVVEDDQHWLVMEHLAARSLAQVVADHGPLPPHEAARIGGRVAAALAAAHAAGLVHRDVKPSNVLIGHDGTVKLTDFGISRALDDGTLTGSGMIAGTPAYLAPEVARGEDPSAASDVFSLGATLYAATEGQPPFGSSENSFGLLFRAASGRIQPPVRSGALTGPLGELLAVDPAARPTAEHVVRLLADLPPETAPGTVPAVDSTTPEAPPETAPEPSAEAPAEVSAGASAEPLPAEAARPRSRRGWLAPAVATAILVVAAAAVTAFSLVRPDGPELTEPAPLTTPATGSSSGYPSAPPGSAHTTDQVAEFVTNHYLEIDTDPEAAWRHLDERMRPSFDEYVAFWKQYDLVQPDAVEVGHHGGQYVALVDLIFAQGGGKTVERYRLTLRDNPAGGLLITSSTRV
ncbi:serine/threonine-protein kinase [Saccharothrix coeruleofusca]|uniref:non-specific serine/threonine protein kinase n=1 Tax=Saccharothrix coeruleofusca TaxID=33919 RepID=A0A918AME8_9PSEU|nr:serine/threonine-protein kinase [Saccharothrix coeruleofusca]MBP2339307.1 serine/threonine protein kinase [Saccharothrix coeruleofusca]GGP58672.1 hypothetical protein GCM10010185_33930 [Saccharothrix coeruleofusca]